MITTTSRGQLSGIGLGPGDPELITVRGAKRLTEADVIAYPASGDGQRSQAWAIARHYKSKTAETLPLVFPLTGRGALNDPDYRLILSDFYNRSADQIAAHLDAGRNVALPVMGDPFLYGSFIYWYRRLEGRYRIDVIPGVSALTGGASRLGAPLCLQEDILSLIPATLPSAQLREAMLGAQAFVIFKLGGHLAKVRHLLNELGFGARALYIERATMSEERLRPLADVDTEANPYFALIIVPTERET